MLTKIHKNKGRKHFMKKKLTLLVTIIMLLGLAACESKTETPASSGASGNISSNESASTSKENSDAVEKETSGIESVVEEIVEAIEGTKMPQKGDVTDKMYFSEDVYFTSSAPRMFYELYDYPELDPPYTGSYYKSADANEEEGKCIFAATFFQSGDVLSLIELDGIPLNTPEGVYNSRINDGQGYKEISFDFRTKGKDGREYYISVGASMTNVLEKEKLAQSTLPGLSNEEADELTEEYLKRFLQLVQDFLDSDLAAVHEMSNIQYDLSVPNGENCFSSPNAIATE